MSETKKENFEIDIINTDEQDQDIIEDSVELNDTESDEKTKSDVETNEVTTDEVKKYIEEIRVLKEEIEKLKQELMQKSEVVEAEDDINFAEEDLSDVNKFAKALKKHIMDKVTSEMQLIKQALVDVLINNEKSKIKSEYGEDAEKIFDEKFDIIKQKMVENPKLSLKEAFLLVYPIKDKLKMQEEKKEQDKNKKAMTVAGLVAGKSKFASTPADAVRMALSEL